VRVGFCQFDPQFAEVDKNLEMVTAMLEQVEADLIVLPELFACGYRFLSQEEARSHQRAASSDGHFGCAQR
jgi:predicted amidohydrolase